MNATHGLLSDLLGSRPSSLTISIVCGFGHYWRSFPALLSACAGPSLGPPQSFSSSEADSDHIFPASIPAKSSPAAVPGTAAAPRPTGSGGTTGEHREQAKSLTFPPLHQQRGGGEMFRKHNGCCVYCAVWGRSFSGERLLCGLFWHQKSPRFWHLERDEAGEENPDNCCEWRLPKQQQQQPQKGRSKPRDIFNAMSSISFDPSLNVWLPFWKKSPLLFILYDVPGLSRTQKLLFFGGRD